MSERRPTINRQKKLALAMIDRLRNECASANRAAWGRFLRANGYSNIGRGSFAHVFASSAHPDLVIRVARKSKRCDKDNDYWLDRFDRYAFMATRRGRKSPYQLRIYHYEEIHCQLTVAITERCHRISYKIWREQGSRLRVSKRFFSCSNRKDLNVSAKKPLAFSFISRLNRYYDKLDLHEGNVMQRSNGQLVITDPFVGSG